MKSTYELINDFREEMNNRFDKIESCYVRQDQFKPIERIVYGAVTLILVAVVGALIALVINKSGIQAKW